jgi:hypothetical protein
MRIPAIILSALLIHAAPVLAHPDHDDEEQIVRPPQVVANDHIVRLISQAKLPASWAKAHVESTRQRTVGGASQTVVTFVNPAEKSAARRKLHVVLDGHGNVIAADHVLK